MKENLSDKEIYEMERQGEELLEDPSMTEERKGSEEREQVVKDHLSEAIKEKGLDDEEVYESFLSWIRDLEAHTGAANTVEADIESFRERASVLYKAGLLEGALDELTIALEMAFHDDGSGDLYESISAELDKIEEELGEIEEDETEE